MASGKKKTRSTNRGWWWTEFTEHPGYESSEPISMVQQKAKVICTRQLEHYVAAERARDEIEVQFGSRDHVRDEQAIKGAVWATGQHDPQRIWHVSRPKTLMTHIQDCELHTESVRSRARGDLVAHGSPNKSARFNQIAGPSSASYSPALGLLIPGLSAPSPIAGGSLGLLSLPSPLALILAHPSPAISDITLLSLPSKRQRLTNSGTYRSVSQPVTAGSVLSPLIGAHWSTSQLGLMLIKQIGKQG
ncbi:hypothetical protein EDB19DRAFT_1911914 [Suillus lakei]|nr:hypothetical protein EDB19DRAFT_1911914 [Suillus lakei]